MADIVDSTRLANRLDLDDQRALASAFRTTVLELAGRHGAHVMRFEGDGAFISFGHPEPREDAAEAAVRVALELVGAVRAICVVPGVVLELRVGVASGRVAVGDLIDHAANVEEAVEGPIPSMAERLKSLAEPGWVVIADSTKRLAAHFFDYLDLGTIPAKGFDGGLRAWRVLGETAVQSRFEALRFDAALGEIVGRDDAIQRLVGAWHDAIGASGRSIALIGDAGMGKSRLARAVLARAQADGARVLEVQCTPSTGNSPLYPIGVLLRRAARIEAGHGETQRLERARQLLESVMETGDATAALPYLAPLFGIAGLPLPGRQTPGEVRDQVVAVIVRILHALADRTPLALLCEDLHWIDPSTAGVIRRVAAETGSRSMLLVVTSRTLVDAPVDADRFDVIELRPLDADAATTLVRSLAPGDSLSHAIVGDIVTRGEGVPLFLEEVTRNALEAARGGEPPALASVPATLQLVVQARLGRWPQLKPIVQAASVLGRDFSIRLLEEMLPERSGEIAATVALLSAHGLFAPPDPRLADRAQFKHALIRDTVYQTLLRGDRQRLHSRAADTLAGANLTMPESSAEVLAQHLVESRRFVESGRTRLKAAAETAARGAFVEAAGHCDAALGWIDSVENPEERRRLRFDLLVQRAVALTGKSGYGAAEVEDAYRRAHALCDDSVTAEMRYPIIRGLAGLHLLRGQLATAHAFSLEGLQLAEASGETRYRLDALSMRIYTTLYFGRLDDCRVLIDRFLRLYREVDGSCFTYPVPHDAGTAVLAVLPTVAWLLGDAEGAEAAIREGLDHVERLARPFDQAMLHAWVAGARLTQRRYLEAAQHAVTAVEISGPRGFRDWLASGGMLALLAQMALQPSAEAIAQVRHLSLAFEAEGVALNASYYRWGLAHGLMHLEDWAGAEAALDAAVAAAATSEEFRMDAELLLMKARLPRHRATAASLLQRAHSLAHAQGAVATALRALATLALHDGLDDAASVRAKLALERLDAPAPPAVPAGWMAQAYAEIEHGLKSRAAATQPGSGVEV